MKIMNQLRCLVIDEAWEEVSADEVALGAHRLLSPFIWIFKIAVDLDLPSHIHPFH